MPQGSDAGAETALVEKAHILLARRSDDRGNNGHGAKVVVGVVLGPYRAVVGE